MKPTPFDIPAIFVNQATLSVNHFGWRLTFSESPDGSSKDQQHRVSVMLPPEVGLNLKKLFDDMVSRNLKPDAPQN